MSIESHLVSLRTYLEEVSSQNKQILAELKRIGASAPTHAKPDAFIEAVTQDVLSKSKVTDKSAPSKKKADKKSAGSVTPAANWNS